MTLLHGFDKSIGYRGGFVSIGNFDGVHRGHQAMIAALVRHAQAAKVPAVVLTFEPHPITLLRPDEAPPGLSTVEQKVELLEKFGVDFVIAYPTDLALLQLTPDEFFEQIVCGELKACGLVEGPNFFFGHHRAGNVEILQTLCDSNGISLDVVAPVTVDKQLVSSSSIRSLILEGNLSEATALLGHPYQICGTVTEGASRGKELGFPTANLERVETLLPANGVYAGIAYCQGNTYPAAINLGPNPTFHETNRKLEVHLLDFAGELYGQALHVDFLDRVREVQTFANADALKTQLQEDIGKVRELANRFLGR